MQLQHGNCHFFRRLRRSASDVGAGATTNLISAFCSDVGAKAQCVIMSYWLVAIPNDDRNPEVTFNKLTSQTVGRGLCEVSKFKIPSKCMKVGTLDSLMALSDDLAKIDTATENVVKKCEKTLYDLVEKDANPGLYVENAKSTYCSSGAFTIVRFICECLDPLQLRRNPT